MVVVSDYRGFRIDIVAQFVDTAWNAGVRIRPTLSELKRHVEQVTCKKSTAIEAGEGWRAVGAALGGSSRYSDAAMSSTVERRVCVLCGRRFVLGMPPGEDECDRDKLCSDCLPPSKPCLPEDLAKKIAEMLASRAAQR